MYDFTSSCVRNSKLTSTDSISDLLRVSYINAEKQFRLLVPLLVHIKDNLGYLFSYEHNKNCLVFLSTTIFLKPASNMQTLNVYITTDALY